VFCYHPTTVSAVSAPPGKVAAVSVDLDAIECYFRIYALPGPPPAEARFAVLRRCLPRFVELFDRHGVRATFFVVGRDLEQDPEGQRLLGQLAAAGHELANHSYAHPYDLTRLPPTRIAEEIDRSHGAIAMCAGAPPVGFRAPGYETSATVIDMLVDRGYSYDSSTFPSIPYYLAKVAVMAGIRLAGRRSGSILGRPAVLRAPRRPYRPSGTDAYRRGQSPLVELPMTVTPFLRLPVYGSALVTAPPWLRRRLVASALREPLFNLELHGIDLCDAEVDDIPPALIARQLDLQRSLPDKWEALDKTLRQVREAGAIFRTLREVARSVAVT
jgi:peptidoglycan/xylan/chitin deacetylase (PgdA/CDA1 family)